MLGLNFRNQIFKIHFTVDKFLLTTSTNQSGFQRLLQSGICLSVRFRTNTTDSPKSTTTEASPPIPQPTIPVTESTQLIPDSTDTPPQTEPKSLSKEPPKQQSDAEPPIFQAKGALIATPYVKGDRLKVVIDKREYDLLCIRGRGRKAYISLSEELKENGSKPMFLRLYPNGYI